MLEFLGALFNALVRLLAVLLGLFFVLTIAVALVLFDSEWLLLSPTLYQTALDKQHVYERLPALAAEQIYMQMHYGTAGAQSWAEGNLLQQAGPEAQDCALAVLGSAAYADVLGGGRAPTATEIVQMQDCGIGAPAGDSGIPPFLKSLTMEQWGSMLGSLLPSDWLKAQTESVFQQAFDVIDTPGAPLQVNLSLKDLKTRLAGPVGVDIAMELIRALPPCAPDQTPSVADPATMLECRPSDAVLAQSQSQIAGSMAQVAAGIPDQVDLLQPLRAGGLLTFDATSLPAGPRQLLQIGRWAVRLSPLLGPAILFLIALLVVRSWKSLLRWWGFPVLAAGLATLLLALLGWFGLDALVSIGRDNIPANISPGLYDTAGAVLVYVVHRVVLALGVEGIALGLIGLLLLIGSYFLGRTQNRPATAAPAPAAPPPPPARPPEPTDRSGIFG